MRVLLLAFLLTGCQTTASQTHVIDITNEDFSNVSDWATGKSCAFWIGPIGPFASNSIPQAAFNGKIKRIRSIQRLLGTMIVFSWDCTKVYGDLSEAGIQSEKNKTKK